MAKVAKTAKAAKTSETAKAAALKKKKSRVVPPLTAKQARAFALLNRPMSGPEGRAIHDSEVERLLNAAYDFFEVDRSGSPAVAKETLFWRLLIDRFRAFSFERDTLARRVMHLQAWHMVQTGKHISRASIVRAHLPELQEIAPGMSERTIRVRVNEGWAEASRPMAAPKTFFESVIEGALAKDRLLRGLDGPGIFSLGVVKTAGGDTEKPT